MALVHRRLLLPGRTRGRELLPGPPARSLRDGARLASRAARLFRRVSDRVPVRARPHRRSRAAGALLAHAGAVPDLAADAQDLLPDVVRRVSDLALQRMRLRVVRGGDGRAWLAPVGASAA